MPTVDDVGKVAVGLRADPLGYLAALLAAGVIVLLVLHFRAASRHAREIAALNTVCLRLVEDHTQQLLAIYQGKRPPRASRRTHPAQEAPDAVEEEKP